MVASRSARAGGHVHIGQLAEGLRHPDRSRRKAQWLLCGAYALGTMAVITLSDWVDGGTFEALQREMASAGADGKPVLSRAFSDADLKLVAGGLPRIGGLSAIAPPTEAKPAP